MTLVRNRGVSSTVTKTRQESEASPLTQQGWFCPGSWSTLASRQWCSGRSTGRSSGQTKSKVQVDCNKMSEFFTTADNGDGEKKAKITARISHLAVKGQGGRVKSVVTLRGADISHQHTQKKVNIFLGEWDERQHLTHTNKHT